MAQWRWGERIGSGGFGAVHHATRVEDGLPFAVKFLLEDHAENEDAVGRFKREVKLQASLNHPNILPIVAANLEVSPPFFVMPIAERTLLHEIQGGLAEAEVDRIFTGVLEGVAHAHERGVVHRDLKPENVMINYDRAPQVSDFGLGRNLLSDSTTLTVTLMGAGSFPYIAPEQMIDLHGAEGRADIYALGKILQHMLTREVPVRNPGSRIPAKYRYFLSKCIEAEADDRYQSMVDVISAFKQVTQGVERPEPPLEEARRLIAEWQSTPPGPDVQKLQELHQLLERHGDDMLLYQTVIPELPQDLLADYVGQLPNEFRRVLTRYDEHVSGSLNFDYCDVVAKLYRQVWDMTDDLAIRKMLLARLIQMGASHNRFFVGQVVGALLPQLTETSEVMMATDVLRGNQGCSEWFRDYVQDKPLASSIHEALQGNGRGPPLAGESDDWPPF